MTVTSFTGGETRFVPFISHSVLPSAMELARPLAVSIMEEAGRFDCWAIRPLAAFLDMLGVTEAEASVWGAKAVLDEFETRYDGSFCDLAEWGWGHADAIGEDSPLLRFVDWGQAAESFHEAGWEFVTIPPSPEETPCPRCADHGPLLVFMPLGWK